MLLGVGVAGDQSVTAARIDAVRVPWPLMNQTSGQSWSASIAAAAFQRLLQVASLAKR